jgi:hypothetical protein
VNYEINAVVLSSSRVFDAYIIELLLSMQFSTFQRKHCGLFDFIDDFEVIFFQGYIFVYDGIPSFPGFTTAGAELLAVFCGVNSNTAYSVTASSGYLTVFYEAFVDAG